MEYAENGLGICVISTGADQDLRAVRNFFRKQSYKFPVLIDNDAENLVFDAYKAKFQPQTYFIRPDGTILKVWESFSRGNEKELQRLIHRELHGHPLPNSQLITLDADELEAASDVALPDPDDFFTNSTPLLPEEFSKRIDHLQYEVIKEWEYERDLALARETNIDRKNWIYTNHYARVTRAYLNEIQYMPQNSEFASIMLEVIRELFISMTEFLTSYQNSQSPAQRRENKVTADELEIRVNKCTDYLKYIIRTY